MDWAKLTAEVAVDPAQWSTVFGYHAVNDYMARPSITSAVTAAPDNFPIILSKEVLDRNSSAAIELEDLIRSSTSSAADNVRGLACGLLERGGVFADFFPPDIFQGAIKLLAGRCASKVGISVLAMHPGSECLHLEPCQ